MRTSLRGCEAAGGRPREPGPHCAPAPAPGGQATLEAQPELWFLLGSPLAAGAGQARDGGLGTTGLSRWCADINHPIVPPPLPGTLGGARCGGGAGAPWRPVCTEPPSRTLSPRVTLRLWLASCAPVLRVPGCSRGHRSRGGDDAQRRRFQLQITLSGF